MNNKIIAIIQARVNSTRFPSKVLKKIRGKPLIEILIYRLSQVKKIDQIILATTKNKEDKKLVDLVTALGYPVFCGSEDDVLSRYYETAKFYEGDSIIRITGDCPLIDPDLVDTAINKFQLGDCDYISNTDPPTYPDGLDIEMFSFNSLEISHQKALKPFDREHVTSFIRNNQSFVKLNFHNDINYSKERWTVDEKDDLKVIKNIINHFYPNFLFKWQEILDLKKNHPNYFIDNEHIIRNSGSWMGKGQKLYKRAKQIIPGGTMLLSKRPEMFLPDYWPSYFSKADGCKVWDMDNNEFIDMSIMGIGTNTLGYNHPEVDKAVKKTIERGNMSTLNCPEEVYLAEKLIDIHPWADMVRFARSGGEANAIAVRIARAASGKDKIAICGYHGWHDWYLSTNLGKDSNLDGHLLPGLDPKGVPRKLKDTTFTFDYNDIESLKSIISKHDIGIVKMEVHRNIEPKLNYLNQVRKITEDNNIILIFDECTSGFRETFGGIHKKYNVNPDMIMLGKTLGNGYGITAVLGKREVMEFAEESFISSTFWTERIGPTAALKTLEIMEREKSWEKITTIGRTVGEKWKELAKAYDIPINISGIPALINFSFPVEDWLKYKTLITQEMLKKGFLAGNSLYVCIEHRMSIIEQYFEAIEPIFSLISNCEKGDDVNKYLDGDVCHSGFKRLN